MTRRETERDEVHPNRNATGFTNLSVEPELERVEMVRSFVPGLSRVAVLANPANPASPKALGIGIPPDLLLLADKVIE